MSRTRWGLIRPAIYILVAGAPPDAADWSDEPTADLVAAAMPEASSREQVKLVRYATSLGPHSASLDDNLAKVVGADSELTSYLVVSLLKWPSSGRRYLALSQLNSVVESFAWSEVPHAGELKVLTKHLSNLLKVEGELLDETPIPFVSRDEAARFKGAHRAEGHRGEILFTGFEKPVREELETLAETAGLIVRVNVSAHLTYVCTGPNAGWAKLERAKAAGAEIIDESRFRELVSE